MKQLRRIGLMIALTIGISTVSLGQNNKNRFGIEIDPATFAWKGYGVHLRWQPKNTDHLLLGIGAYALDMPDPLINLNKKNREKGWGLRLSQGLGLFGEYHFSEVNKKWFSGVQLGIQEFEISNTAAEQESTYSNFLAMAYGGYSWQPFNFNLYIKPWAGMGYVTMIDGSNRIEDLEYDIAPITGFMTLHLGYTF